jgi:hypothetical protein
MVRHGLNLWQAVTREELGMTTAECEILEKNPLFQQALRSEALKFHTELATDPNRSKLSKIGQLEMNAAMLEKEGKYDKAAEVHFKIAKMEAWVDDQTTVNVFGLSSKELSDAKEKIKNSISRQTLHENKLPN